MKIFYAIQATGNGHISRAMELLPYLQEYGNVDIFLSGANSTLALNAPIKYRSRGLSLFYNCSGGLDHWKLLKNFHPLRLRQEIRDLPVEKYDLVINDFEYITATACNRKKVPSINFGHQASFYSPHTPRPEKRNPTGEWVLRNYARASRYVGLHFQPYDDFIFTPVVKKDILNAEPTDKNYITVYLPSYCEPELKTIFDALPDFQFQIFSRQTDEVVRDGNITFIPVDTQLFNESLIHCTGIITGGGFETPAEALHLGKKIISIPIRAQYEQQCNAAALQKMGVLCLKTIDEKFNDHFYKWMNNDKIPSADYSNSIPDSLSYLFSAKNEMDEEFSAIEEYDILN
ncbi:MAG: glycosyltransferase family protein [Chitinophagaceae bacterium]